MNCVVPYLALTLTTASGFAGHPVLDDSIRESSSWAESEHFFGDWGGARTRLKEAGIGFDSYYVANPAGNVSGGKKRGFSYVDNLYLGVTFDLERLMGWQGATFAISGINRSGGSVTEAYVGSQYDVQQVQGGQNIFFYNLTLEQRFWDDKARFKVGRFAATDDFNTSPIYGLYMNNGIDGNIRNVMFDTQIPGYPFATWAARLRLDPTPVVNFQIGAYQNWDDLFDRTHNGLNWSIRDDDGVIFLAQLGWTPELFKRPLPSSDGKSMPEMKGMPGHYWIGGSYSSWNGFSQFGKTEKTRNSYGFYAHADQMVYQEAPGSEQGLTLFVASGYYPQDNIAIMPFQVNVGAFYTGLIPGRDYDKAIVGFIHGRFGDDYARELQRSGGGNPTHETVVELAYRIQLAKFAYFQPDIQFITRPGGTGNLSDAIVIGAQAGITF